MVPPRHRLVLLFVIAVLASLLAGCAPRQEPPRDLTEAAATVAREVRGQPGVESARSSVTGGYSGGAWIVTIHVRLRAAGDLTTAAATAAATLDATRFRGSEEVTLEVVVPDGPGLAPVTITDARSQRGTARLPAALEAADALRRAPVVGRVDIASAALSVGLAAGPTPLVSAAEALRGIAGFGTGSLAWVTVDLPPHATSPSGSVEIAADGPSIDLLAALDQLEARPEVSRMVHHEQRGDERPRLDVETSVPESVARLLTSVTDAADRLPRQRTAFSARVAVGASAVSGFVGLPQTGEDPPPPASEAAPILATYEAELRTFLLQTAKTDAAACTIAGGRRVQCETLLALWHDPAATEESVEASYAAITAAWQRAGLVGEGRALGTELWGRGPHFRGPAGVDSARIRGTTDGIRVTVESPTLR
ncbi:hypothetical protein ACFRFH_11510 [Leifsonia sp. NPDC056824]|uniref:hypothetical protein n=1 Tax=Leifsonia sp. NPDC056824 TaxID=3345953 RepID=UPI003697BE63